MPAEIEPTELARVVDFAERPRTRDWSLRSALVRYAQPQPQRVNDLLDLVRRTEWALGKEATYIARNGPALWGAMTGELCGDLDARVVGILRVAQTLDRLGDVLATWADDRSAGRPDAPVDEALEEAGAQLDALGVPHQERPPGPRNRG